jgi:hypothetical protein
MKRKTKVTIEPIIRAAPQAIMIVEEFEEIKYPPESADTSCELINPVKVKSKPTTDRTTPETRYDFLFFNSFSFIA